MPLITYKRSRNDLYSAEAMRRAIALLLMLVFSSMLMAPLFASDPESNLPPCCRRHGKHRCMMQGMQGSDGRPGFAAVREKCPCFPAGTVAVQSVQFAPGLGCFSYAAARTETLIAPQTQPGLRSVFLRSHPKRGPPSLLG
jgi:hypothetical protein